MSSPSNTPSPSQMDTEKARELTPDEFSRQFSLTRRVALLILFCLAQFLDTFNYSALFSAIPTLSVSLNMSNSESTWIISAFSLTFGSFLLISGRISDVYSPKWTFIIGIAALGLISLGAGFLNSQIPLIVLRAFSGIAGSMTIPSALSLIVTLFPRVDEQSRAIGAFGGCGALGNVLGYVVGGIFVEFATWHWCFWFVTIVALPIAGLTVFLIPVTPKRELDGLPWKDKFHRLDIIGVSILTAALILFIFAVISGSTDGWPTAEVLVPLFIAVLMIVAFFVYETRIPVERSSIPPHTWFYPNFSVVFAAALFPFFWWATISTLFTILWQESYHRSAISSAVHLIPSSVMAFLVSFTGPLSRRISPKWLILSGQVLIMIAAILLTFSNGPDKYWRFVFPAFVIGAAGAQLIYTHTNVAIFRTTPPSMAGTVGAIYNGALQLGSAVGLASVQSITNTIDDQNGGNDSFVGRRDAYWFVFALICAEALATLVFYSVRAEREHAVELQDERDRQEAEQNGNGSRRESGLHEKGDIQRRETEAATNGSAGVAPAGGAEAAQKA
ncbi:hypothetical protein EVG20_g3333 [Dentipellis fragilis]|uniref:Major facilitator superfamily (MFS) profile domain-containing protein n=1 Tax=Dentipellis fragilis TaxID=205917 RepID=A0A4Y9Z312_9AGAM|nr:hypothetical protein EVG20_g3333 [Dentipellis fragilis]